MSEQQHLVPANGVRVNVSKSEQKHQYDVHVLSGVTDTESSYSSTSHSYSPGSGSSRSYSTRSDSSRSGSSYTESCTSDATPTMTCATGSTTSDILTTTTVNRRVLARNLISKTVQQYLARPTVDFPPRELLINLHFPMIGDFALDIDVQPEQSPPSEQVYQVSEPAVGIDLVSAEQKSTGRKVIRTRSKLQENKERSTQVSDDDLELIANNLTRSEEWTQEGKSASSQYEQITSPAEMVDIPPQPMELSFEVLGDETNDVLPSLGNESVNDRLEMTFARDMTDDVQTTVVELNTILSSYETDVNWGDNLDDNTLISSGPNGQCNASLEEAMGFVATDSADLQGIYPLPPQRTSVELIPNQTALSIEANGIRECAAVVALCDVSADPDEERDAVIEDATHRGGTDQWSQTYDDDTKPAPTEPIGCVDFEPLSDSTALKCVQTGRSMLTHNRGHL